MTENESPAGQAEDLRGARSFSQFIQMLDDGRFNAELTDALRQINAEMKNHAQIFGGKCRGALTLKVEFTFEKGYFEIAPSFDTKLPKVKRNPTIAWSTSGDEFTPENPKQMNLFGKPRDVTDVDVRRA